MRACDRCNAEMNVGRPRVRVNKQMWCQTCAKDKSSPSGKYKPGTDVKTAMGPGDLIGLQNSREFTRTDMKGALPRDDRDRPHDAISHLKKDHGFKSTEDLHGLSSAEIEEHHQRAHAFEDSKRNGPMGKYMPPMHDHTSRNFDPHRDAPHYTLSSLEPTMAIKIALREQKTGQRLFVLAHDSGDGETIYHCPFCGSGQVLARSDRTIECEFCHTSFTVQVQPEYSAFPQTMDGQPVQVPGMPGQIDQPVGGGAQDPAMAAEDTNGDGIPDAGGFDDGAPASPDNQPPWLTAGLKTSAGKALPLEEYVHHLAIKHSGAQRTAVLRRVKASREFS